MDENDLAAFDAIYDEPETEDLSAFDSVYDDETPSTTSQGLLQELAGIKNVGVKAGVGMMSLVEALQRNISPLQAGGPKLFGLNENIDNAASEDIPRVAVEAGLLTPEQAKELPAESFTDFSLRNLKDWGILSEAKPESRLGKTLGYATQGAIEGAPAGPAGMTAGAILSAIGGTVGGEIGKKFGNEERGAQIGSVATNLGPAVVSKTGLAREAGELLGPLLSELPGVRTALKAAGVNPTRQRLVEPSNV